MDRLVLFTIERLPWGHNIQVVIQFHLHFAHHKTGESLHKTRSNGPNTLQLSLGTREKFYRK